MEDFFVIVFLVSILAFIIVVVATIVSLIKRKKPRLKLFLIPVGLFVVGVFGFGMTYDATSEVNLVDETTVEAEMVEFKVEEETTTEPETTTVPETAVEPETTTTKETTTTEETITEEETEIIETTTIEETTSQESEEEFKASCEEIGYKKLLRTPDDYVGRRVVLTAKVQQVVDGGWLDDGTYYRIQTDNEGKEYFYDDEYFMYDCRTSDDMKILKDDVLKIYAEFAGLETVKRALTRTGEEVPAIKAYYVELISE